MQLDIFDESNIRQIAAMDKTTPAHGLANLGPLAQLSAGRLPARLLRLLVGLFLYGLSVALMVRGALGASPWDVFHLGAARHLPLGLGTTMVLVSLLVLLAWIPLRQWPGLGTIANSALVGPFADLGLAWLPSPGALPAQLAFLAGGIVLCGLATATYVGAQLGPGPRDGLMTGLARRTGWSLRAVRTGIEVTVLAAGAALGGTLGLGTVAFALAVGPITQALLPHLVVRLDGGAPTDCLAKEAP